MSLREEGRRGPEVISADLVRHVRLGHPHVGVAHDGQVVLIGCPADSWTTSQRDRSPARSSAVPRDSASSPQAVHPASPCEFSMRDQPCRSTVGVPHRPAAGPCRNHRIQERQAPRSPPAPVRKVRRGRWCPVITFMAYLSLVYVVASLTREPMTVRRLQRYCAPVRRPDVGHRPLHPERVARHHAPARTRRSGSPPLSASRTIRRTVGMSKYSTRRPRRVRHQVLREVPHQGLAPRHQAPPSRSGSVSIGRPVVEDSVRVSMGRAVLTDPPPSGHVEIVQRQPDRDRSSGGTTLQVGFARCWAIRSPVVRRRPSDAASVDSSSVGHVRRRRRRRRAHDDLHDPLATQHR